MQREMRCVEALLSLSLAFHLVGLPLTEGGLPADGKDIGRPFPRAVSSIRTVGGDDMFAALDRDPTTRRIGSIDFDKIVGCGGLVLCMLVRLTHTPPRGSVCL